LLAIPGGKSHHRIITQWQLPSLNCEGGYAAHEKLKNRAQARACTEKVPAEQQKAQQLPAMQTILLGTWHQSMPTSNANKP
jgi:hypothetical protein